MSDLDVAARWEHVATFSPDQVRHLVVCCVCLGPALEPEDDSRGRYDRLRLFWCSRCTGLAPAEVSADYQPMLMEEGNGG